MLTVLILGTAWFTVGALGKAAPTQASREIRTGQALQAAKNALLSHVAQYAARDNTNEPGQLPCPESLNLTNVGKASSCSATAIVVGRLPWKTLGIDQLRDGGGEPLWYVMRGFRDAPINFGTPGQLSVNGSTVVAVIIAPGRPLNTAAQAGAPPAGCSKLDQFAATRGSAPLNPAHYLECGTATGIFSSPEDSLWTNDRIISITATEWADAIAGPVADRMQRQVAPALNDWRTTQSVASWGTPFLPNASTFSSSPPPTNNLCGDLNEIEGMPPTATVASGSCNTAWASGSASGLGGLLSFDGCVQTGTELRCSFTVVLGGIISPTVTATAPSIAHSFRSFSASQIVIEVNCGLLPSPCASVSDYSPSVSAADGSATISFQVNLPPLSIADSVIVHIPNPADALLADARTPWFINNNWDRFTYYAVSRAATVNPLGSVCAAAGDPGCLTVNGMATPADDKRLVLALMGRALASQTQPSASEDDHLEQENAISGNGVFDGVTVTAEINDRIAACPLQLAPMSGPPVSLCN